MCSVFVFEGDVFEDNVAFDVLERYCAFAVLDLRLDVHDLHESLEAGVAVLELLGKVNEDADRFCEGVDIEQERDEVRDLDEALGDQDAARDNYCDVDQEDEGGHAGVEETKVEVAVLLGLQEGVVAFFELGALDVFVSEGFDDADTGEIVLDPGVDLCDLGTVLAEGAAHLLIEKIDEEEHYRDKDEGCGREVFADTEEDHESADYLDAGYDDVLRAVVEELGDLEQVAGDPAHELTDFLVVKE